MCRRCDLTTGFHVEGDNDQPLSGLNKRDANDEESATKPQRFRAEVGWNIDTRVNLGLSLQCDT